MSSRITVHQLSFSYHSLIRNTALIFFSVADTSAWLSIPTASNKIIHLSSSDIFHLKSFSEPEIEVYGASSMAKSLGLPLGVQRLWLQEIDESCS